VLVLVLVLADPNCPTISSTSTGLRPEHEHRPSA